MSSTVELIKERLNIADVIGSYLKLEKSGASLKARCPFHNERTASFFVSPERGTFYCFGCGAKGDVFSFVQSFEGVDFMGALKTLASRAGVEIVREDPKERSERERIFTLLETAMLLFRSQLTKNKKALDYLSSRALSLKTQEEWNLGFALDEWRSCLDHFIGLGFTPDELEKAGLIKREDGKVYDRFRSRIMFPIFDSTGRVVAFSGRILGKDDDKTPKYLNSPETQVFSKSRVLYGLDRAKTEIRRLDYSILVEGQMDLLMAYQAGFKNTVAISGTAFTGEQVSLLKRLSNRILMVYDSDKAGVRASLRSAVIALKAGMDVKVAALPKGKDPADLIREDVEVWKECLKSSKHVIDFYLDEILSEHLEGRKLIRAVHDRLLPYVASLESSIEKEHFISEIAKRTGISIEAIADDLKKLPVQEGKLAVSEPVKQELVHRKFLAERLLWGLVFWQEGSKTSLFDTNAVKKEMERILGEPYLKSSFEEAMGIREELEYQAEVYYGKRDSYENEATELLVLLEEDTVKEQITEYMKEIAAAEREKDKEKVGNLLARCQELNKILTELKRK